MKNGKYSARRSGSKMLVLALALVLTVSAVVGGTLAWLTATSNEVKNTFTTSDISVTLSETTGTSYKMIPGYEITKDPKVTVKANSEECWLFVEITKSSNFDTFLEYTMADDWTQGKGSGEGGDSIPTNVYYRKVEASTGTVITSDTEYVVIKDNKVTVKSTVTKSDMNGLKEETRPTLTFKAYASQLNKNATEEFNAAEAWANMTPSGSGSTDSIEGDN